MPARKEIAVSEPAEVPTMTSESRESQPVALQRASMTPLWWAAPENPQALRTRPIVVSVPFPVICYLSDIP